MKSFVLLKLPLLLCGFGGFLLFSPASRAQEVNPDHFDGPNTEPLHLVRSAPAPPAKNARQEPVSKQTRPAAHSQISKSKPAPSLQLATAQDIPQPLPSKDVAPLSNDAKAPAHKAKER